MLQPNLSFLLKHPAYFFALGFGSGLLPKAPGTFGTLVAIPLSWCILDFSIPIKLVIIAALFIIGVYFCNKTSDALGVADHGSIVWDEIVGMMLVLTFTPRHWGFWVAAFVLFRLFDIWKPYPIRQLDAKLKNGFGVMLDDALAAVYAIICIIILAIWVVARR